MDLSQYWHSSDQQDRIMSALAELDKEGSVNSAGDWAALKAEVLARLEIGGVSGPSLEELVKPLDEAVASGSEFKSLVSEMVTEYKAASPQTATPQQSASPGMLKDASPDKEDTAFIASLPDLDELATQIVMDLGTDISQLIASDPELATVSDKDLIQWIIEDVSAAIDEIGEYGWEQLG